MKIKKDNQLGLNFTQVIKDGFYKVHSEKFFDMHPEDFIATFREQWKFILNADNGIII